MQSATEKLILTQGNPMRLLANGDTKCECRQVDYNEERRVWEVSIQTGWYMLDAMVELNPMGQIAPAADCYYRWLDFDTADMVNALTIQKVDAALSRILECAVAAVSSMERKVA